MIVGTRCAIPSSTSCSAGARWSRPRVSGRRTSGSGTAASRSSTIRTGAGGAAPTGAREIDATGRLLLPGGVDPHVHLHIEGLDPGEPGWVDDYTSGSQAALAGGITSVGNMSYVLPWESIADRVRAEEALVARQAIADVFFHTVIVSPGAASPTRSAPPCAAASRA